MRINKDDLYKIHGVPSPEDMAHLADAQSVQIPEIEISDYAQTIRILKNEKDFSFTEIVEFFAAQGIPTNRSAVYRVYKDPTPPEDDDPLIDDETGERVE